MVQELLPELFGIELSVGSINQLRQESSASVAAAAREAQAYVQAGAQVNIDETSFGQGNTDGKNPLGSKGWLWVMVTPLVSYFAVCLSRSGAVCQQLLGDAFVGIALVTALVLTTAWHCKTANCAGHISNATLLALPNAVESLEN
jgi:transposase